MSRNATQFDPVSTWLAVPEMRCVVFLVSNSLIASAGQDMCNWAWLGCALKAEGDSDGQYRQQQHCLRLMHQCRNSLSCRSATPTKLALGGNPA